jgi:hypothetical protein
MVVRVEVEILPPGGCGLLIVPERFLGQPVEMPGSGETVVLGKRLIEDVDRRLRIAILQCRLGPGIATVETLIPGTGGVHAAALFDHAVGLSEPNDTGQTMKPSDLLTPTPAGLYCPPADIYIDPVRPVARALITHGHSDHARAGHGRSWRRARRSASWRALWRGRSPVRTAGWPHGETVISAASISASSRPGMCSARRRSWSNAQGPAHRRLGRLQARARPDLRALRTGSTATSSSPRRPSACRCFATRRPNAETAKLLDSVRAVPRARASRRRLFAGQGAALDGADPRGRLREADLYPWRD